MLNRPDPDPQAQTPNTHGATRTHCDSWHGDSVSTFGKLTGLNWLGSSIFDQLGYMLDISGFDLPSCGALNFTRPSWIQSVQAFCSTSDTGDKPQVSSVVCPDGLPLFR